AAQVTMRFAFSREQIMFRDTARDLLHKHCPPAAVRTAWAEPSGRVPGLWARLAEVGIVGLTVPEAQGGPGLGEPGLVLGVEEAGRAALPEPLLEPTAVAAPLIHDAGTPALRETWLPRIASGEAMVAVGLHGMPHVAFAAGADLLVLQHGDELHA